MTPERLEEIRQAFSALIDRPTGERQAVLERLGDKDPDLRVEAEKLLAAHDREHPLLDGEAAASLLGIAAPRESLEGRQVGAYRVVHRIAEGGMGTVFEAQRTDDVFSKRVAVKVCKATLVGETMRDRFRRERQILARLEHPNIARILDGGTTEEGAPYFVMEYVDGLPLDQYVQGQRLGLKECLRLFCDVCGAVAYAHRNLVVHRDLKPSNVFVTRDGTVKLLDFGIAKLLEEEKLSAVSTQTAMGMMTPQYAAPEQIRGEPVTIATDVYALGVLLYELLTGQRPYRVRGDRPWELAQAVLEQEPTRPSAVAVREEMRAASDRMEASPDHLGLRPAQLRRHLRGDLDRIVLKALEKRPNRRYSSAEALAADTERYLDGRPVAARGDDWRYRVGKFVRRHKTGMAAAALVLLSLIGGLIGTAWQAGKVRREAERTAEVQRFLLGLFHASGPREARGRALSARDLLDRGAQRAVELGAEPGLQARLCSLIGSLYVELGEYPSAEPLLRRALELEARIPGRRHPHDRFADLLNLVHVYYQRGAFTEATRVNAEAMALARGTWGPRSVEVARSLGWEAWLRRRLGRFKESETLRRQMLEILERKLGPESEETRAAQRDLATLLADMGVLAEAEALQRQVLDGDHRQLGPDHPETLNSSYQLARILVDRSRLDQAERVLRELLPVQRRVLGERHDRVAMSLRMLARALEGAGRFPEARSLIEDALAIQRERLGAEDAQVAVSLRRRASIEARLGDLAAAEGGARQALRMLEGRFGPSHYDTAAAQHELAEILLRRGSVAEADELLQRAEQTRRRTLGANHYQLAATLDLRAVALERQGEGARAVPLAEEALAIARASFGEDSPAAVLAETHLARALLASGDPERARGLLAHAAAAAPRAWPAGHPDRQEVEAALAR